MKNFTLALLLIICLTLSLTACEPAVDINAAITVSEEKIVDIPSGSTSGTISTLLYEAELTPSENAFRIYAKDSGIDTALQAGQFAFSAGDWNLVQIGELLISGSNVRNEIIVTIPEGLTAGQTFERFVEAGCGNMDAFLSYAANGDFSQYPYIPALETIIEPGNRLDGFLFPETYYIDPSWSEAQIIDTMLAQFATIFTDEWHGQAQAMNMSVYEIITLASIIEKEAVVQEDRPIISGVFHKRLGMDMLLQSCATIQFLLGEPKVNLSYDDLAIDSPYNSYTNAGLPPAPIACPGKASIEAALYPVETDYLYFRARTDGSHRFSVTYEEHNTNQPGDQ